VDGTHGAPGAGRPGSGRGAGHGGLTEVREVEDVRQAITAALGG